MDVNDITVELVVKYSTECIWLDESSNAMHTVNIDYMRVGYFGPLCVKLVILGQWVCYIIECYPVQIHLIFMATTVWM